MQPTIPPPPPPPPRQGTRTLVVVALVAGLAIVSALGFAVLRRSGEPGIDLTTLQGRILFATARDEPHLVTCHYPNCNYDVYVSDADGSDLHPLATTSAPEFAGCLSADGTRAVIPRVEDDGRRWQLVEVAVDGDRSRVLLSEPRTVTWPQYSPDGSHIVFEEDLPEQGRALFLLDVRSGAVHQLTQTSPGEVFIDAYATWSPDGRSVAFVRTSDAAPGRGTIQILDVSSGTIHQIFDLEDPGALDWSPDGASIAAGAKVGSSHEVFLLPADGVGDPTQLTHGSSWDGLAAWSPDGAYLVFTSNRSGTNDLYVMRADGSGATLLPTGGGPNGGSSWSVAG